MDFRAVGRITLLPNGRINDPNSNATWGLESSTLVLRWPRSDAPAGVWVDRCVIGPDGKSYIGRNQRDLIIRGIRTANSVR